MRQAAPGLLHLAPPLLRHNCTVVRAEGGGGREAASVAAVHHQRLPLTVTGQRVAAVQMEETVAAQPLIHFVEDEASQEE